MKKLIIAFGFLLAVLPVAAQNGAVSRFCDNGAKQASTSGLQSSNYLQGEIPQCTVTIYLTGSTTLAPIYNSNTGTATVFSATITNGGSYSVCPTGVTFSGGGGTSAAANVACTGSAITSVAITNPGSGYTTTPTISFTGGTGSGGAATANLTGTLTNPFKANTDGSFLFFALANQGLDIVMSGGIPPNTYASPRTVVDIFPSASFAPVSGVVSIIPGTNISCTPELAGSCTGNVTINSLGSASAITALTQDVLATGPGSVAATVVGINNTPLSGLATGILKNTTATGVPSIAGVTDIEALLLTLSGCNVNHNVLTATGAAFNCQTPSVGAVSSVSNSDGTLTISPTTGNVIASLNLAHVNFWTANQDFSSTTQIKLPVVAGYTSLANGEIGYDSTNKNWHAWVNGADTLLIPLASGFVSGHCGQPTSSGGSWSIADSGSACGSGSGGVTSVSGDGALFTNSASTGGVTLTLGTAAAHKFWGNNTGSTTTPAYFQLAFTDLSGNLGTAQGPSSLTGVLKDTAGTLSIAASADIIGLWSGTCSSTTFLRGDGSCQVPGGGGTVTTTGSPASGNLTKFSGATSITNADLSGDGTTSGTTVLTLATVNSGPGSCGDATHVCAITTNGKGLTTAQTAVAITGSGTTTNALTMDNSGTGDVSGSTFNGSLAKKISYNTIGAAPALNACTDESSTFTPANGNCYFVTAAVSTATPGAGAFVIFNVTTSSAGSLALTGTTIADGGNCASYISGTTLTLPSSQSMSVKSDGTTIRGTCTVATSGGVASLNALTGALSLTSTAGTVSITPSGTSIDLESTGGGGVQSNAALVGAGDSKWDDDLNAISPTIPLSAFTCATGTCIVTNTGSNNLAAGDWVNMRFSSAWTSTFTAPTDITLSTGYTLFKVIATGLSSTQFEFSFASSGTCASTCGNAAKATYNLPFNINNILGLAANPSVIIPNPVTMQALNTDYTTILHPLSNAVTGVPTYFMLGDFEDDVFAASAGCNSAATIEAAMQSLWAKIHTDTSKVLVWSSTAYSGNQTGIGVCTSAYQTLIALEQWLPLQGKSAANQSSGQYWDYFADPGRIINDPLNTSLIASNGGFTAGSVDLISSNIARVLRSGVSDPLDKRPEYFGAGPSQGSAANGFVDVPSTDAINYRQIFDSAMANLVFRVGTQSGFQGIQVGGSGSSSGTLQASSNMTCSLGTCNVPMVISGSGTNGGRIATFAASSTATSNGVSLRLGVTPQNGSGTAANDNNLDITFNYVGNNSTSNNAVFALTNATNGIKLDGSGNFFVQALGSSTNPLCTTTGGQLTTSGCVTGGTTTNALTMNNSGSGVASGTTFDGSVARVLSYNTLGAAPLASPTFTGTPAAPTATGGTNTTQLATTAFVQAAIAAAGTGAGIVTYSGPALTFTGTLYFPIGGGGLSSTTETNVDIDAPAAVTIQNMTVQMSAAPGVGNSITYTWRKNASSTTLTCTISGASATSCSDTTHNFTTASLDLLDIQTVTTGTVVGTPTVVMAAQVGVAAPGTTAFSSLSSGTNTAAVMTVGSGASLNAGGSGTIAATSIGGVTVTGTPSTGQVPTATSSSAATWQTLSSGAWTNITGSVTVSGCAVSGGACAVSGTTTTAVTFSAIPAHNRMQIIYYGQGSASDAAVNVTLNADTGSHYIFQGYFQTSTSAPSGNTAASQASMNAGHIENNLASQSICDFAFYANTTFSKVMECHTGSFGSTSSQSANFDIQISGSWDNGGTPAAVTSATYTISTGHYVAGTQFMILVQD